MTTEVLVVHGFFDIGKLPTGPNEQKHAPELDEFLSRAGLSLVQGYNEGKGYYLVERMEVEEEALE